MQNTFTRGQLLMRAGEVRSWQVTRPVCLQIRSGRVWVTIEGGSTDYWLSGGQSLDLPGAGLVVIESVNGASKLQVGLCRRHWLRRLGRLGQALLAPALSLVTRRNSAATPANSPQSCSR